MVIWKEYDNLDSKTAFADLRIGYARHFIKVACASNPQIGKTFNFPVPEAYISKF